MYQPGCVFMLPIIPGTSLTIFLSLIFLSLIVYMDLQKRIGSVEMSLDLLKNLK